ncbi:hypothetical protein BgiMline_014341, partial [Biomphalaria glabrata]
MQRFDTPVATNPRGKTKPAGMSSMAPCEAHGGITPVKDLREGVICRVTGKQRFVIFTHKSLTFATRRAGDLAGNGRIS